MEYGGRPGIRDEALIEAAIGRPYTGYYRPIAKKAAALVESVAMNHGFVDGNKRTAVQLMEQLIDRSGYELRFKDSATENDEVENMILDVVNHEMGFEQLVNWFKSRLRRR